MEVTKADLSDLQELAESFTQLGIVELVNVQTNEVTPALPPPEGSTCSNESPQDHPMRESADFHTNATQRLWEPDFEKIQGEILEEHLKIHLGQEQCSSPCIHMKLIDEWVTAIKIAATTLELDKENFIKLVELSLEGSMKIGWDNTLADTKASILAGDSKSVIADRLGRLIKIHFIGDG
ncbi:UNVERIFIED_CONTAM: hypothetical protein Sangu_3045300 [Sesamum angustifolium]|uniref:Uncharacterized protein n=1 Tax=Sesamum angustifolium TaxID=2727405 RepID=A0AAW2KE59_9LAMI